MTKVGYLRVSTEEQRPDRQINGLKPLCDTLHIERVSAVAKKRPVFERILRTLKNGDTLVVWDLDRAFRSTIDALTHAEILRERGIEFQIVTLGVDTSTADGKLVYTVLAAFAEHERNCLSERTKEGLKAAVKRGKKLGRPPIMSERQLMAAKQKLAKKDASVEEIAALNGIHPWTLTRAIKRMDALKRSKTTKIDSE